MTESQVPSHKRSARMVSLLSLLEHRGHTALQELATRLGVSEATVRRDVATLERQGLIRRTHGGAAPLQGGVELPVPLRHARNQIAKLQIAAATTDLIPHGRHVVAFTGGSTTSEVITALGRRDDLTLITNSLVVGQRAAEAGHARVLIAGGVLRPNSMELVGKLTESTLRLVDIGTAVVGADGISAACGLTTHDEVEARTNHAMIMRAARVIAVVDATKFGVVTSSRMAEITEVDLVITDADAPPAEVAAIRRAGVEVRVVAG